MRYREILFETFLNLHDQMSKEPFAEEVLALIDQAYAYIGGNLKYKTVEDLINEDSWWKLVRKQGRIVLVAIFKKKRGAKRVCVATDGSREAKAMLKKIVADDIKLHRGWSEASGKAANMSIGLGLPPVPNHYAAGLLGKEILALHGRFKYDRLIAGHLATKMIIGFPDGERYEIEGGVDPSEVLF